jgi:hypothetical protein
MPRAAFPGGLDGTGPIGDGVVCVVCVGSDLIHPRREAVGVLKARTARGHGLGVLSEPCLRLGKLGQRQYPGRRPGLQWIG